MKNSSIVCGLQWGDEGKGKIIDVLAKGYDCVLRWNGGNNAGHTVVVNGNTFPLSLIPSGALQRKRLFLAQGVVINPKVLIAEIDLLKRFGYSVHLMIDPRCHIVMPYHQELDSANEQWRGKSAVGSLHLGIGYCYEDRNNRSGIRFEDLIRPKIFEAKVRALFPLKERRIQSVYGASVVKRPVDFLSEYIIYGKKLALYVGDVSSYVCRQMGKQAFLFEQAHGTMLDPVFGTYPYTVAPPTISSSVFCGVGMPAGRVSVVGVVKAYTTRVGNGPFPTELTNSIGAIIRSKGHEIGTVSKRPRRCGWLDLPMLRYAVRLNGCTSLAVTKLDVLTGLASLKICVAYIYKGAKLTEFPSQMSQLADCKPVYKTLASWKKDIRSARGYEDLPLQAKAYLRFLERALGVIVRYISVGPDRKEIVCRKLRK